MKTILFLGGRIREDFALSYYHSQKFDRLIAVDGGLFAVDRLGLCPTDIVGDFDTVSGEILNKYRKKEEIHIREFNPEKDATDSQIGVETALALKSDEIHILGATGARMDHTLANIQLLALPLKAHVPCRLMDEYNCIRLIDESTVITKENQYGTYISLLPFTETVTGLTLRGFKYPLNRHTMDVRDNLTLGISNELTEPTGRITVESGILILMESTDDPRVTF